MLSIPQRNNRNEPIFLLRETQEEGMAQEGMYEVMAWDYDAAPDGRGIYQAGRKACATLSEARAAAVQFIERQCRLGAYIYFHDKIVESWVYASDGETGCLYAKRGR